MSLLQSLINTIFTRLNEGKLEFQKEEIIQEAIKLYCRECSEELEYEDSALEF